ncbi:glycosyltransferase family 39 protein [Microlunatus panaciterrae]|uniref:Mannosyltransferase (PIG-V) n=1 Tax=Microlunatus panaciterrae TaxID=400768 RepID=A0ABS2RJB1_9ACTN|nr:hypothetical protein [Microlunatus panaciterrae]MBM7799094.1 hypothetical protein [Microlunatus panaciterrae]
MQVPGTVGRTAARQFGTIGRHLRLAWPVFLIFLTQRLLTVAFVYHQAGGLRWLVTRWDAGWYLGLAEGGYVYPNLFPDGRPRVSNLAFFPLYPWLVRGIDDIGPLSPSQALLAVSWFGGLLAVWAIFAVGNALYGRWAGIALSALWGMAPASLALTMGYPEGLFTAAAAAALFCLIRRRPVWAGVCALVAGLLRPSAVAVIAMVGVYFLVELGRWLALRRARSGDEPTPRGRAAPNSAEPFPVRAFVGAVVSTLGLGGFMVYVGIRTGEVFGYFTVQGQWGQQTASIAGYVHGVAQGLFNAGPGSSIPLNIAVSIVYLLLFCLILFDRKLAFASVYAAVLLVMSLTHVTYQNVYARQLLPAFVLLIPLIRLRVPRIGAITALTLGSIVMSWCSAHYLLTSALAL